MKPHISSTVRPVLLTAMAVLLACGGCALDRLPRIDPSGERFLIFPDSQPVVGPLASSGSAPAILSPQAPLAAPPGNLTAPPAAPVGSATTPGRCPLCPLCPLGGLLDGNKVIGPLANQPFVEPPDDRVTLTPGRILAPVGSEVVLKAGVCGADGYLRTNQRIEWLLGQQGVGSFAQIGEENQPDIGRYPWSRPHKVDSHYAIGYTAPYYSCLRRGTANPSDDLQVKSGEAWISVTSASEGTSYVTAHATTLENWNTRRAQAVIYWVDAQWQFPPPAVVAAGQPHRLTTTVTRQSDGAPLEGYVVRYEVADGSGAQLGYQAGQTAEATTDNRGQATIEITPTDSAPGTSTVRITVARPEQAGNAASPRIDLGSGQTQVTWSNTAAGTQPLFPPVTPPSNPPGGQPPIQQPTQPGPTEPPIGIEPPPTGQAELDLRIRRVTQSEVKEGGQMEYNLFFKNIGSGVARNVVLRDRFDSGLTHPQDTAGVSEIELSVGDLAPGDSREIPLVFEVLTAGEHWHEATLKADNASDAFDRATFTAEPLRAPAPELSFEVGVSPDRRVEAGKVVQMSVKIENRGQTEAQGLQLTISPDNRFLQVDATSPEIADVSQPTSDGGVVVSLPPVPAGQTRRHRFNLSTKQATEVGSPAQVRAFLKNIDQTVNEARDANVEIIPALGGANLAPMTLQISTNANPAKLRSTASMVVTFQNNTQQPMSGVQLQIMLPAGLSPRPSVAQTPVGTSLQANGNVLTLTPAVAQLAAGGKQQVVLPIDAIQQGDQTVNVRSTWAGAATWTEQAAVITVQP